MWGKHIFFIFSTGINSILQFNLTVDCTIMALYVWRNCFCESQQEVNKRGMIINFDATARQKQQLLWSPCTQMPCKMSQLINHDTPRRRGVTYSNDVTANCGAQRMLTSCITSSAQPTTCSLKFHEARWCAAGDRLKKAEVGGPSWRNAVHLWRLSGIAIEKSSAGQTTGLQRLLLYGTDVEGSSQMAANVGTDSTGMILTDQQAASYDVAI